MGLSTDRNPTKSPDLVKAECPRSKTGMLDLRMSVLQTVPNSTAENWWSIVSFFRRLQDLLRCRRVTQQICQSPASRGIASVRSKLLERIACYVPR